MATKLIYTRYLTTYWLLPTVLHHGYILTNKPTKEVCHVLFPLVLSTGGKKYMKVAPKVLSHGLIPNSMTILTEETTSVLSALMYALLE